MFEAVLRRPDLGLREDVLTTEQQKRGTESRK